jgi:hypothetical protein
MKPEHICVNHPILEAISFCQQCKDWLCAQCATEGPEHYFCHKPECIKALKDEESVAHSLCPNCGKPLQTDAVQCGSCGKILRDLTAEEKAEDLVTIARYRNSIEAYLGLTKLEAEGIEAYVADEHMVSINPGYDIAFGGVKLKVKKSDTDKAIQLLDLRG